MPSNFICFNTLVVYVCSQLVITDHFSAHMATVVLFFNWEQDKSVPNDETELFKFLMSLQIWNFLFTCKKYSNIHLDYYGKN